MINYRIMYHRRSRLSPACFLGVSCMLPLLAASCTTRTGFYHPSTGTHVWPGYPEVPRVRHLGEISGEFSGPRTPSALQRVLFGPEEMSRLITPHAVAVDQTGRLVAVADSNAHCVHVFNLESNAYLPIEQVDPQTPLAAPVGVAWGGALLFVADPPRQAVNAFEVAPSTRSARHVRSLGTGAFSRPTGLAYDSHRNFLFVSDSAKHQVMVLNNEGIVQRTIGEPGGGEGQFRFPAHVTCTRDGIIAVSDSMNFRVQRFSPNGEVLSVFGRKGDAAGDLALPKGIAVDRAGNIWIVDAHFENIQAFNPQGELLLAFGSEGQRPGEFWLPAGAFIDNQDRLWVADTYNRRVQAFQLMP